MRIIDVITCIGESTPRWFIVSLSGIPVKFLYHKVKTTSELLNTWSIIGSHKDLDQ